MCRIHLDAMLDIYIMAALNLKMAYDKCPPPIKDPSNANFEIGDMALLRNLTPKDTSASKYQPMFWIFKKIWEKAFEAQDNLGKVKWVSIQHLQLLHPAEHMLTNLPDINYFLDVAQNTLTT